MRKVRAVSLGALSAGAALAVCGCFITDLLSADVTGKWELFMTVGAELEYSYGELRLVQQGLTASCLDDPSVIVTISGFNVTLVKTVDVPLYGPAEVICTGVVTGDVMMGAWVAAAGGGAIPGGTWRATLLSPALVDVSGTWNNVDDLQVGSSGTTTADLSMDADGNVTGIYDPAGAASLVTGEVYGLDLTLTVVETSPVDRTITIVATLDAAGTSASGTWSDTDGNSGDWDAAMP